MKWSQNDELFFKELKEGHNWQNLPALFLKLSGLNVEIPELKIRDNINDAGKWVNSSDLIVNGQTIEIKSRNESFTSASSFPYPTIFVDTVSGYDAKEVKPLAYIMVSRPTGSMLCLRTTSNKGWKKESKFDRIRKIQEEFYVVGKESLQTLDLLVKFIKK